AKGSQLRIKEPEASEVTAHPDASRAILTQRKYRGSFRPIRWETVARERASASVKTIEPAGFRTDPDPPLRVFQKTGDSRVAQAQWIHCIVIEVTKSAARFLHHVHSAEKCTNPYLALNVTIDRANYVLAER